MLLYPRTTLSSKIFIEDVNIAQISTVLKTGGRGGLVKSIGKVHF